MTERYRLIGGPGSPYSLKIRGLMRYRRLPFDWLLRQHVADEVAHVKPAVIPILHTPSDGSYRNDSTPLVEYLEARHPDARSVIPDDPAEAFLAHLIEDLSDEWFTKFMFQHRWLEPEDIAFYGHYLGWFRAAPAPAEEVAKVARVWGDRQVSRTPMVGVTRANQPVIDETFRRVLAAMEEMLTSRMFLFGDRPSNADFAIYGQLQPGMFAPGASVETRTRAPATYFWLTLADDLSGWSGEGWRTPLDPDGPIDDLLRIAGEAMLPFYAANLAALQDEREELGLEIWGHEFRQPPFKYQAKCYKILRARFAALDPTDRDRLSPMLDATGCLPFLAGAPSASERRPQRQG